jgi:hypothetical protein
MPHYHNCICLTCYAERIPPARYKLGYRTCMSCGEVQAKQESRQKASMCIPINKSTPTYISDPKLLRHLNPKRVEM